MPICFQSFKGTFAWTRIIEEYNSRKLTFASDKLPALAGLAQKVQAETKETYAAGLWLEKLPWDLLWEARAVYWVNEKPRFSQRRLESAPSWSWASIDCRVVMPIPKECYLNADVTQHVFFSGVDGLPAGKDAPGAISAATLNIECEALIPVERVAGLSVGLPPQYRYARDNETESFVFYFSAELDCEEPTTENMQCILLFYTIVHDASHRTSLKKGFELSNPKGFRIYPAGLLLEQTGRHQGEYRRLGTARRDFPSQKHAEDWLPFTKIFVPELTEKDYVKRYFDANTGHERCKILPSKSYRYRERRSHCDWENANSKQHLNTWR